MSVKNHVNNGINYLLTDARFLPSTVHPSHSCETSPMCFPNNCHRCEKRKTGLSGARQKLSENALRLQRFCWWVGDGELMQTGHVRGALKKGLIENHLTTLVYQHHILYRMNMQIMQASRPAMINSVSCSNALSLISSLVSQQTDRVTCTLNILPVGSTFTFPPPPPKKKMDKTTFVLFCIVGYWSNDHCELNIELNLLLNHFNCLYHGHTPKRGEQTL